MDGQVDGWMTAVLLTFLFRFRAINAGITPSCPETISSYLQVKTARGGETISKLAQIPLSSLFDLA